MILINICKEVITPESAAIGDFEETWIDEEDKEVSFKELVYILKFSGEGGSELSCSRRPYDTNTWLTHYKTDHDWTTGAETNTTIHYSRNNPARNEKYWEKALRAAGY